MARKADVSVANALALYRELLDAKGSRSRDLSNRIVHFLDGFTETQTNEYYRGSRAILLAWNPVLPKRNPAFPARNRRKSAT